MKTTRLSPVILLAMWLPAAAQQQLKVKHGCAYKTATEDATLYTFEPSDEAQRIVKEICNAVGVGQNFDLRAANVDNALACAEGNNRIILYSTVFLKKFNEDARTRWAAYSVLAHEIGHHFNGHDFGEPDPTKRKKMELEADRFSGSALRLLGASLDEANAGVETFALDTEQKYHPPARARRESIATGWTQQQERLEKMGMGSNTNPSTGLPRERDSDSDGIPDKDDACPEEYGRALTAGCPDADEDGVPDRDDACRYRKGPASWKGCPDTDGDGLPDHEDQCPDKPGYAADKGCPPPDGDGDSVPDRADKCPSAYGLPRYQGCPDTDGDGVPDPDDKCPKEKGEPMYNGCPSTTSDNMILVRGGAFIMGCKDARDQDCIDDEKPAHSVTLSDFYIGKYEVTNSEFVKFLNAKGNQIEGGKEWVDFLESYAGEKCRIIKKGSNFRVEAGYENYPMIYVSWYGAKSYCEWMSEQSGRTYRLPTEAEWEYAARGGNLSKGYLYAGSNIPADVGWFNDNLGDVKLHNVGRKKANELELYDMSGNVYEWCGDWYDNNYYKKISDYNPVGANFGNSRTVRGGSWTRHQRYLRITCRGSYEPNYRGWNVGFRLVMTP